MFVSSDSATARELDARDKLAAFRQRFVMDDPQLVYLDGNSLGRLPQETAVLLEDLVRRQWGQRLIRSWGEGWMELGARIGGKIAQLVGAQPDEVIVADSTSVNLFKLVVAALQANPRRHKVVTDDLNFPSDLYILQGAMQLSERPFHLQIVPSHDGIHACMDDLLAAIDDNTTLVTLSHTTFKSGYLYDMAAVTQKAHRVGALVLWDLSHSVGAVPVDLHKTGADLAVGCTYKHLHGGPGAPAFLYVRADLQKKLANPISGWMGRQNMFNFALDYEPAPGLRQFLTGTPPILSMAAIEPGVDLVLEAGISAIRAKSVLQTEYLISLWQELLAPLGFQINSPPSSDHRGSHVSLGHPDGWRIDQALIEEMNVIPDFRQPDNLRLGIAPLYTSYTDVWTAVSRMCTVVKEKRYEKYSADHHNIT